MLFILPPHLIVGIAVAAVGAAGAAANYLFKGKQQESSENDHQETQEPTIDAYSRARNSKQKSSSKAAKQARKQRRNEMVRQFLSRHNLNFADRSNLYDRNDPLPLLEAVERVITDTEIKMQQRVENLNRELTEIEMVGSRFEDLADLLRVGRGE